MRYLVLDTETGGLGLDKSLLSLAFVLADKNLNILEEKTYNLMPDDGVFTVCPEGLAINKIDLVQHVKTAITYSQAKSLIYKTLCEWSSQGKEKLIPVGKQIAGDIAHIHKYLLSKNTWEQFVSYRVLDASSVFMFLRLLDVIKEDRRGSLSDLLEYYLVPHNKAAQHDALYDSRMTLEILTRMKNDVLQWFSKRQGCRNEC